MRPLIAVALSGGVDSLVAAHLLKQGGHDLIGLHFLHGAEMPAGGDGEERPSAPPPAGIADIGKQLALPVETIDLGEAFHRRVVDDFVSTYQRGMTPNPCAVCNQRIKFGALLEHAKALGASKLATGHYARTARDAANRPRLLKGSDPSKDQSYFLALLSRSQLDDALFPVGEMTKSDLMRYAENHGLRPLRRSESQDICFIGNGSYGDFIAARKGFAPRPGRIEDMEGNVIGEHGGLHLFTVGQRRGINCPAPHPYYVVRLDARRNRLVVGEREALAASACTVTGINWIGAPPDRPLSVKVRVRYRGREVAAVLHPETEERASVRFASLEYAVTPGQVAVFYRGPEVLGGGWIASPAVAS